MPGQVVRSLVRFVAVWAVMLIDRLPWRRTRILQLDQTSFGHDGRRRRWGGASGQALDFISSGRLAEKCVPPDGPPVDPRPSPDFCGPRLPNLPMA